MAIRWIRALFFSFWVWKPSYAFLIGNPADPALFEKGIWFETSCVTGRIGYMEDWTYKERFQNKFLLAEETHTKNQLTSYSGIATINAIRRVDVYGILGSSQMQIDEQIFSEKAFSWCMGLKLIFLKHKDLFFGADIKYFETNQHPTFFVIEELPYNVVNDYQSKYASVQLALGIAYRIYGFVPYINGTYIEAQIMPAQSKALVRFPDTTEMTDISLPVLSGRKKWGMALGFSLFDLAKASLAVEWRTFNQNGINVNGELRF